MGVQAQIRQLHPKAIFTHCAAHCLSLVLNKASVVDEITFAVKAMKKVTKYFCDSPLRNENLLEAIDKAQDLEAKFKSTILSACAKRGNKYDV